MRLFRFAAIAAMSFVMVGALAAQAPPPQQPPSSPRPEQAPAPRAEQPAAAQPAPVDDAAEITIVGCLAQAQDAANGYTLTVVPAAPAAPDAASAAAGAPANAPPDAVRASSSGRNAAERPANAADAAAKPATYRITGIAADQLKPHLNHHVEIKGRIGAPPAGQTDPAAAQEFRGSSVKMLNATCPAAK